MYWAHVRRASSLPDLMFRSDELCVSCCTLQAPRSSSGTLPPQLHSSLHKLTQSPVGVQTKDFPYSLAACTGTLISPRHVLTASHCLVHFKAQPGSFAAQNLYGDDRIDMGQIVFAPGLARPCRDPFGISYVVKTRVPRNYVRCNNINNDLGCTSWDHGDSRVLMLKRSIWVVSATCSRTVCFVALNTCQTRKDT